MKPSSYSLTLLTVNYKSAIWLNQNIEILRTLNTSISFKWIVVNNTPESCDLREVFDPDFTILKGSPYLGKNQFPATYHHAQGLNSALPYIKSDYLIVIDPDFFLYFHDGLSLILNHMAVNNLSFFGVPWHPIRPSKYRDFPCVHFMAIDTSRVDLKNLNFSPFYEHGMFTPLSLLPSYPTYIRYFHFLKILKVLDIFFTSFLHLPILQLGKRFQNGRSLDTGSSVYMQYFASNNHDSEVVSPIFHPSQINKISDRFRFVVDRFVDLFVPSFLKLHPYRYSFVKSIFPDSLGSFKPEEFSWRGSYFGFHMRLYPSSRRNAYDALLSSFQNIKKLTY